MDGLIGLFAGLVGFLFLGAAALTYGVDTRDLGPSPDYRGEE